MPDKIYWDTSIFIDWLKNSYSSQGYKDGVEEIVSKVEDHELTLITSIITKIEVLEGTLLIPEQDKFNLLFKRKNVVYVYLESRIAERAHSIRNFYHLNSPKLKTPDVIHLATAIHENVSVFYTTDGKDMLKLNGSVAGYPLQIQVPISKTPKLPTF